MCLLVVMGVIGVFIYVLPRNSPTLIRILTKLTRTLITYGHIQLIQGYWYLYTRFTTKVFDILIDVVKRHEDGFKKRLCKRVLLILFGQRNRPDVEQVKSKKLEKTLSVEPKLARVKMLRTFNTFYEIKSGFKEIKEDILSIKKSLGLL